MTERPKLSSIEPLEADTRLERGDYLRRASACLMVVVALLFLYTAAEVAWSVRTVSHFSDAVFGVLTASCVGVPAAVAFVAVRRAGWDILPAPFGEVWLRPSTLNSRIA